MCVAAFKSSPEGELTEGERTVGEVGERRRRGGGEGGRRQGQVQPVCVLDGKFIKK